MISNIISTDAILLTKKSFGDGHINLCLLTSDMGLIRASAFGGQRLSKRFKGGIEYFQIFEAEIQKNMSQGHPVFNLSCIKKVKHSFTSMPMMMERYVAASYIQEMASLLLNPLEKSGDTPDTYFEIMVNCMEKINASNDRNHILDEVYNLSISLYKNTGFIPHIECADNANAKLCRLENYNSSILEKTPKSFLLLSELYDRP
ncbi:MAG: recombination protein O N-terminal domain-containing protein [Proteobacteria bacterium]|nr:recombination protein O N-terminal domain-containing protein [Pseudomonadota bacterium]